MNNLQLIREYFRWYLKAKNLHGIHSPFLYNFAKDCLYRDFDKGLFGPIEDERKRLKSDNTLISYMDPGAGNRGAKSLNPKIKTLSVKNIAHNSLQNAKYGRLFYALINYFGYRRILEMGTSLGITTSYMSMASKDAEIETIEGVKEIAEIASRTFQNLNCPNITLHIGNFDDVLPDILSHNKQYDLVFIDGNHRGSCLLKYFDLIIKHIPPHGVIIVDDIRWSESMNKAWQNIILRPEITMSVDLFFMGLAFINPAFSKDDFQVRF
jgi:predicted O-methyltransferase YrrM